MEKLRLEQLNEIVEFSLLAYERSMLYEEKMKLYHNGKIEKKEFTIADMVLHFEFKIILFREI